MTRTRPSRWFTALLASVSVLASACATTHTAKQEAPRFNAIGFFTGKQDQAHISFLHEAFVWFPEQAARNGFHFDTTSNWANLNDDFLKKYQVVVFLDTRPEDPAQRAAFQRYMENGGAWLGFHVAAFNDRRSRWTWFREFIGGAVFGINSWPPLPAKLIVDEASSPVTRGIPKTFVAPTNEWYAWRPSPRLDKNVRVLLTLDPAQYPLGIKNLITEKDPDVPVVWTNTNFKMLYMNMGHGDKIFTDPIQNKLFENGILWLLYFNSAK